MVDEGAEAEVDGAADAVVVVKQSAGFGVMKARFIFRFDAAFDEREIAGVAKIEADDFLSGMCGVMDF